MKKLQQIYNEYLENFHKLGLKPAPDKLLALLLLQDKNKYKPRRLTTKEFYKNYQTEITEKINKVITDFNFSKEDIMNYIKIADLIDFNYEQAKIWQVFKEGFECLRWGILYRENSTPEEIYLAYQRYFHKEKNIATNHSNHKVKKRKLGE